MIYKKIQLLNLEMHHFYENIFPCKDVQDISSVKLTYDTRNGGLQNINENSIDSED